MSDYKPITSELRKYMGIDDRGVCYMSEERFDARCDEIDAIHAQLELENAALKSSVAHAYASGYEYAEMDRDGWIELPKDADGVPIRVGDAVEYVDDTLAPRNVTSINLAGDGWWVYINGLGRRPDKYRHVTPDTWERIIDDAEALAREWFNTDMSENEHADGLNALVARCKKLAGEAE